MSQCQFHTRNKVESCCENAGRRRVAGRWDHSSEVEGVGDREGKHRHLISVISILIHIEKASFRKVELVTR